MNQERLLKVLVAPHISEKAALAGDSSNAVVFKVVPDATKREIKSAVEKLFKVKVDGVQVSTVKGKVKRNRYGLSRKPSWKKAYVSLAAGHDIDFALAD
ncbi:MAG: 50S ribosomal protein L23 [Gammaproteobacteria bacterium]|nr:50S ribosomal protein L23 [Gammaproteobacteria bacterium]